MKNAKNITGDIMKHEVDLEKYQIHTDLAIDLIDEKRYLKGVRQCVKNINGIKVTDVNLKDDNALLKKGGNYVTIEFEDITDTSNYNSVKKVVTKEIKKMLKKMFINNNASCLFIGLGNSNSTPDSLGPMCSRDILVTNHIYELGNLSDEYRRVSSITPSVTGVTGIETSDIIESIVTKIKPDFIVAVDALASGSVDRVNKTIQMTDTGIHPGSGIGNERKEISFESINIPVLAIGVPTVVGANVIVSDTINYMYKHYSFSKEYMKNPKSKLTFNNVDYLKENIKINDEEKKELFGLVGSLNDSEIKELISEVLSPIGYNLMVTPKEIDFIIPRLATLISNSINDSLHFIK